MNRPTVHYDPQSDILYFLVRDGEEERFVEVAEGVNVELDQEGQLLGVEILNASRFLLTTSCPLPRGQDRPKLAPQAGGGW